ncbi:MAG: cellulase family glycosylhydrolase [Acidobacteriaceae bacterium]|nr:cellulase family glycosylhydrolase [Acidobacteriaceae bacterium]
MLATSAVAQKIAIDDVREVRIMRHRFGVNYIPTPIWQFGWNNWNASNVARDFDSIASLGADHIRVMLIWPWFQPNPTYVSTAHLDRFEELMILAEKRNLDVAITLYTGWLSGYAFKPPFLEDANFYTDSRWKRCRDLYLREVSRRLRAHSNFLAFDLGNEIECCWSGPTAAGDAWMSDVFQQMKQEAPGHIYVNGVSHYPWFREDTFSPQALVASQKIVAMHCWPEWTGANKYGGFSALPSMQLQAGMAALARSYGNAPNKPIWVQEFGLRPNPEAPDLSAWLEKVILNGIAGGVSWFTWWGSHDIDRRFQFSPEQYTRGLITTNNKIKDHGHMFKQLADTFRGKPVAIPSKSLPPPPAQRTDAATWKWLLDWMGLQMNQ